MEPADEDDGFVEYHQGVEIAVLLSQFPVSLSRLCRFEESNITDDGVTSRTGGQSPGSSRHSPNQSEQNHHYG